MSRFDYVGRKQAAISFPLGGIGSGCVGLSGAGRLIDWEIFNRPNKGAWNGFSHFALRTEGADGVRARVLCADMQPPFAGIGYGAPRESMSGLPHFRECAFEGKYPFAALRFAEDDFPAEVTLTAFNPFIPTNEDDSSLPAAFLAYEVHNRTGAPLDCTLAGTLHNPFGGAVNETRTTDGRRVLFLRDGEHAPDDPKYGDLTLACDADECCVQTYWYRGAWFDNLGVYWKDLLASPDLRDRVYPAEEKYPDDHGTLAARFRLAPGERRTVRFVIAWNVPNCENYWWPNRSDGSKKPGWRNWYATRFADSAATAAYALQNWARLEDGTRLFQRALFSSTVPDAVLDAVSATMSVLKSPTVLRLEDGSLYGWEGCGPTFGSCEGSCTHVWAYAYANAYLFPRLERSMRDNEFGYTQDAHGGLHFRLMLPLGEPYWDFRPCADGQFATVFKVWREYLVSGDTEWLRGKWPGVQKAIAYAWDPENPDAWDPDKSGVLTGRQHHTLDMELFGPNSWLTSMYLCALRAAEEMANVLGDASAAGEYHAIFARGSKWCAEHLYNGEYFRQNVDLHDRSILERFEDGHTLIGGGVAKTYWNEEDHEMKYQVGDGCAIDQVLGQWHADLLGLGDLLPADEVCSALRSIHRYNFTDMREHINPCRLYCLNDERGTLICSYPAGHEKPVIAVPYAEETMHGFEYQAAAHMIARGLIDEGLELVEAVRARYDGERRNPWNEVECGSNYARSMASFALLTAYAGMTCDLGRGYLGFKPVVQGDFTTFWSLDSGFGLVRLTQNKAELTVLYGTLTLRELGLPFPASSAAVGGNTLSSERAESGVRLTEPVVLRAGQTLTAEA